jgi:hypothetical protein
VGHYLLIHLQAEDNVVNAVVAYGNDVHVGLAGDVLGAVYKVGIQFLGQFLPGYLGSVIHLYNVVASLNKLVA